jgi:hypothetical protein
MRLPQFSAESSLYKTSTPYYTASSGALAGRVVPQLAMLSTDSAGGWRLCCWIWCYGYWCWYYCWPCGWGVGGASQVRALQ